VQGQLGEKLVPDLIRVVSAKESSGLLRISRGKVIKAIFFDKGLPVFAISNLGSDQLEHKLIQNGLATEAQIQQGKQLADKPHRLASVLVQTRVLSDTAMRKLVREQVMEIILSLFEWLQGEYVFDEKIRASHEVTLNISVADILLEGARRAALIEPVAAAIAPTDGVLIRARPSGVRVDSGRLIPLESYVLSRIEAATAVSEVGMLSGIPEVEAHRAICALVAAGFLKLDGVDHDVDPVTRESEEQLQRLRDDVARKLHFFSTADYYEILGVGRQATTSDIKAAYYQLAKKFHPDRYRTIEDEDLQGKLESLFATIATAYETLTEPPRRAVYDDNLRKAPAAGGPAMHKTTPLAHGEPVRPPASDRPAQPSTGPLSEPKYSTPVSEDVVAGQEPIQASASVAAGDIAFHPSFDAPAQDISQKAGNPSFSAEQLYQQGRARFDRKEYHAAVHLLREAIKLDNTKAPYHFHLGIALIRNPRTRREAEYHLQQASKLDSYSPQMRTKLGTLYKEMGLHKKAEAFFKDALKLDPENRIAKRELESMPSGKQGSAWKSDIGSFAKKIFKK
jgi:curved DNA-binding protein CbpA